jgi:predicted dehydrogenase
MVKKVKWGVMGTAMICERDTLPGMMQADNCELYAIAGRSMEKAERFQKKYGFVKAYNDYQKLVEDNNVDAIYIALPNSLHFDWTIKALKQKKHVLCEKPIAPTAKQVEKMMKVAEENGVYLMEAFAFQHSPYLAAIKAELEQGSIGRVQYMESAFITSDYAMDNIRMRKELLGGCTYDLGVYNTSLILRMLGEAPVHVQAIADFSDKGIDKLTSVIMHYEDGKTAAFTCGMVLATEKDCHIDRFEIQGIKGTLRGENFVFNGAGELSYSITDMHGNIETKVVSTPHNYKLEVEQLGRCIMVGEKPSVTSDFSITNALIIDKILKSIGYYDL